MLRTLLGPLHKQCFAGAQLPAWHAASVRLLSSSASTAAPTAEVEEEAAKRVPRRPQPWFQRPDASWQLGYDEVTKRQEEEPAGRQSLMHLARRIGTAEQAAATLGAVAADAAKRAAREPADHPTDSATSKMAAALIRASARAGALDVAEQALQRSQELGLQAGARSYQLLMAAHSSRGDLPAVQRVFDLMTKNGVQPKPDTAFLLVRAALDAGQEDLANTYVEEFAKNNVKMRPAVHLMMQAFKEGKFVSRPGRSSEAGSDKSSDTGSEQ